jgi:hypothetical protein
MASDAVDDPLTRPSATSATKSSDRSHIGNAFAGLTLKEPSDKFLNAPTPEKVQLPIEADDGARYQAERLQKIGEQYLAAHCLLADISSIRSHIKSLWTMYRDGQIDLHSVSVTTNTAVELVRGMQEDYDANFPDHSDFEGLIKTFYIAQCVFKGQDPNRRQRPGDIINMAMYDLADQILLPTYTMMASLSDVVAPGQIPLYKPGHFGFRDLSTEWPQKSPHDKLQDDKLVLFEAFSGFSAIAKTGCFAEEFERWHQARRFLCGSPLLFRTFLMFNTLWVLNLREVLLSKFNIFCSGTICDEIRNDHTNSMRTLVYRQLPVISRHPSNKPPNFTRTCALTPGVRTTTVCWLKSRT